MASKLVFIWPLSVLSGRSDSVIVLFIELSFVKKGDSAVVGFPFSPKVVDEGFSLVKRGLLRLNHGLILLQLLQLILQDLILDIQLLQHLCLIELLHVHLLGGVLLMNKTAECLNLDLDQAVVRICGYHVLSFRLLDQALFLFSH